ncbi:MAG: LptF/LptG family permease, partial [Candidatus Omnitrophota bacterium]
ILKHQLPLSLMFKFYLTYLPNMFVQIAPFACLLSTLYAFGKLNHTNEIIAMRSSGLSIYWISKTAILFGLMISLFIFWLNERIIPQASALNRKFLAQIDEGRKGPGKKPETIKNLCMYGIKNRLFFINRFNAASNTMEGLTILEHDEYQNIIKKIVANRAVYADGGWKLYQSIIYDFDRSGQIIDEPAYNEEINMAIPEKPKDFLEQKQRAESMTIAQIDDYLWRLSKSGATTVIRNFKVDLYQRFTSPFTSLIIMLLGIPFSLTMKRRSTGLSSIGVSIVVGFLYYIIDAVSIALGKGGLFMPILSASLSHILALFFALCRITNLP